MKYIDVFNGDADGIFSLVQWRKAYPVAEENQHLITGVKRDNALIKKINNADALSSEVSVFDVSFDKNTKELKRVLSRAKGVYYCDHHQAKTLFEHPALESQIDFSPRVCTGLLVSKKLNQAHHAWAIAAAFGDGLDAVAEAEAKALGLHESEVLKLKELGVLVNYNGYGVQMSDLHFAPDALYKLLADYKSPVDIVNDSQSPFQTLKTGYEADTSNAVSSETMESSASVHAVVLPDCPWARRISGTYGNQLAAKHTSKAVIIATYNQDDTLTISLRAPKNNLQGAGDICGSFATGGGRAGAAGINALAAAELDSFIKKVDEFYKN